MGSKRSGRNNEGKTAKKIRFGNIFGISVGQVYHLLAGTRSVGYFKAKEISREVGGHFELWMDGGSGNIRSKYFDNYEC